MRNCVCWKSSGKRGKIGRSGKHSEIRERCVLREDPPGVAAGRRKGGRFGVDKPADHGKHFGSARIVLRGGVDGIGEALQVRLSLERQNRTAQVVGVAFSSGVGSSFASVKAAA